MGYPRPHFVYFCLFKQTLKFLKQIPMWKNVHPLYGAGIWTHNIWNMSLLPSTTRPGLPPSFYIFWTHLCIIIYYFMVTKGGYSRQNLFLRTRKLKLISSLRWNFSYLATYCCNNNKDALYLYLIYDLNAS